MQIPCPKHIECPCDENPATNYSEEAPDTGWPCATAFFEAPMPLGWGQPSDDCESQSVTRGQATVCAPTLALAQQEAQQAAQKAVWGTWTDPNCQPVCVEPPCPPGPQVYCNSEQVGYDFCPDGSVFTYTVPAGTFCCLTQEEADAQALSLAQKNAKSQRFCCGGGYVCCCVGNPFAFGLTITDGTGPFTWVPVSGSWPSGVGLTFVDADNREANLAGTALVAGATVVQFAIYDLNGNYLTKNFVLYAIEVATTAIPAFTVGTPYSFQLTAAGGSGSYAWRITSGTLPAGLTMSIDGLISGTPTASTTSTLTFEVIDLTCENTNRLFYPPRIALTGRSTTTVATIKGFEPYSQTTTPPKKYKKLAWTGTSEQWATTFATGQPCAGAKYVWSGVSEIDLNGNFISRYRKDFYAQCPFDTTLPAIATIPGFGLLVLEGYCWPPDPGSCPSCPPSPYDFVADRASNSINDQTTLLNDPLAPTHTQTPLSLSNVSGSTVTGFISGPAGFPSPPQIILHASHNYSSLISDEYTDAEALLTAATIAGNGLVAESRPRTTGFTSTWTAVQFRLACSNLLAGENYTVQIEFWTDTYTHTDRTYTFTATGATYLITDTIPTPPDGHTLEARNPQIAFA